MVTRLIGPGGPFSAEDYIYEHLHSVGFCAPDLANSIVVTSGAGAWNLGNFAQIIALNAITSPFDIHFAIVHSPSANAEYQIYIYDGGGNIISKACRFQRINPNLESVVCPIISTIVPANTMIQVKMADSAGANTCGLVLLGHTY